MLLAEKAKHSISYCFRPVAGRNHELPTDKILLVQVCLRPYQFKILTYRTDLNNDVT